MGLARKVFICYAHQDKELCDAFVTHLMSLQRQGLITLWYDGEIRGGAEWDHEIKAHLEQADIILLLVTADFLASEYIYRVELQVALAKHREKQALVIPVLLRPVSWQGTFDYLQALPSNGRPVSRWRDRNDAFLNIVEEIRQALSSMECTQENTQWLRQRFGAYQQEIHQKRLSYDFTSPKDENEPFTPTPDSFLVGLLQDTFAALTPQRLLKINTSFENITAGKELLEEVSKLIEAFENYFDELLSIIPEGVRGDFRFNSRKRQKVLRANRKLITISNEMRSIYQNIDRRFTLSPDMEELINRITSICVQIFQGEVGLIVMLSTNPGTLRLVYLQGHFHDTMRGVFGKDFVPDYGELKGSRALENYHLALIELNHYKLALRELVQSFSV
jgi:TIR domain